MEPISWYKDDNGFISLAATAANSGPDFEYPGADLDRDVEHSLVTYYIKVSNTNLDGIHRGNSTDIYIHDPSNYQVGVATGTVSDSNQIITSNISSFDPYVVEILSLTEHYSQEEFDPSSYNISIVDKSLAFSNKTNFLILFEEDSVGTEVDITYRHWSFGSSANSLIIGENFKFPASDMLVKAMPPHIIQINDLEYSGGVDEVLMKDKFKDYINSLERTSFDKSDFVDLLYANGATHVNLDMDVSVKSFNTEFVSDVLSVRGQAYEMSITQVGRFYANDESLVGISQV